MAASPSREGSRSPFCRGPAAPAGARGRQLVQRGVLAQPGGPGDARPGASSAPRRRRRNRPRRGCARPGSAPASICGHAAGQPQPGGGVRVLDDQLGQHRDGHGPRTAAAAPRPRRSPSYCRTPSSQVPARSRRGTTTRPRPSCRAAGTRCHRSRRPPAARRAPAAPPPAWPPPGPGRRGSSGPGRRTSAPGHAATAATGPPRPACRTPSASRSAPGTRRPGRRTYGTTGR